MGRLTALEVFPTLARYKAFRPRRANPPIGNTDLKVDPRLQDDQSNSHKSKLDGRADTFSHLYHDLGVLAFAGCTAAQTERIGSILQRVVAWGGPAHLTALIRDAGSIKQRVPGDVSFTLAEGLVDHSAHEEAITNGSLSVETILANSDKLIERSEPFASVPPPQRELFLKSKKSTRISRVLSGPGVFLETDTGKRRLPLAYHVSLSSKPGKSFIETDVWLSTIGKGNIVGRVKTLYETGQVYEQDGSITAKAGLLSEAQTLKNKELDPASSITLGPRQAAVQAMMDLWALEREIWADRSNVDMPEREKQETRDKQDNTHPKGPKKKVKKATSRKRELGDKEHPTQKANSEPQTVK